MGSFSVVQVAITAGASLMAAILSALVTNKLATRKSAGEEERAKLEGAYIAIEELINVVEHITYRCEASLGLLRSRKDSSDFLSALGDIRVLRERSITLYSKIAYVSDTYLFLATLVSDTPRREFAVWMELALLLETRIMQVDDDGYDTNLLVAGSKLSAALTEYQSQISRAALISLAKAGNGWPLAAMVKKIFSRSSWWRDGAGRVAHFLRMKDNSPIP